MNIAATALGICHIYQASNVNVPLALQPSLDPIEHHNLAWVSPSSLK